MNAGFVTKYFSQRRPGVIWRVKFKDKRRYIFPVLEFQNSAGNWMTVRLKTCAGLLFGDLIRTGKVTPGEPLPGFFRWFCTSGSNPGQPTWIQRHRPPQPPLPEGKYAWRTPFYPLEQGNIPAEELSVENPGTTLTLFQRGGK